MAKFFGTLFGQQNLPLSFLKGFDFTSEEFTKSQTLFLHLLMDRIFDIAKDKQASKLIFSKSHKGEDFCKGIS
jgi:hypothetical protein